MKVLKTPRYKVTLNGDIDSINAEFQREILEEGLELIHINLTSKEKIYFPKMTLICSIEDLDIHVRWNPKMEFSKGLSLDWDKRINIISSLSGAPVECLLNYEGMNKLTYAISDTFNSFDMRSYVVEETAELDCTFKIFEKNVKKMDSYQLTLRLDMRDIPYYQSIVEVSKWWEQLEGNKPAKVPPIAKLPMYSAWYSFHQNIDVEKIINQCKLVKEYGCEAIIIDDGWQTGDNNRGYAFCGDWEPAECKIKDMTNFVQEVHNTGLKFLLWYSVPFVGINSKVYERFKDMLIDHGKREWSVLDPRYPEVREYIINTYEKALLHWDIDGFKLDFVDEFVLTEFSGKEVDERRDYESMIEASDRLLKDCIHRLKTIKPYIMIEFRQTYIGPVMRTYGNMLRALDCPIDSLKNRIRTVDLRLLSGNTAVHSDMLMWNAKDSVESAAMQITNILFSVPQISVLLDEIPETHREMLKFYMDLWMKYKEVLIEGKIIPISPDMNYPLIYAINQGRAVIGKYSDSIIELSTFKEESIGEIAIVNSYHKTRVLVECPKNLKFYMENYDCCGHLLWKKSINLIEGINNIHIPKVGVAILKLI